MAAPRRESTSGARRWHAPHSGHLGRRRRGAGRGRPRGWQSGQQLRGGGAGFTAGRRGAQILAPGPGSHQAIGPRPCRRCGRGPRAFVDPLARAASRRRRYPPVIPWPPSRPSMPPLAPAACRRCCSTCIATSSGSGPRFPARCPGCSRAGARPGDAVPRRQGPGRDGALPPKHFAAFDGLVVLDATLRVKDSGRPTGTAGRRRWQDRRP